MGRGAHLLGKQLPVGTLLLRIPNHLILFVFFFLIFNLIF